MLNALTEKRTRGSMLWDYLTTVDHKKIAILYLVAGGFFFLVGGIEAMFIRIQLAKPENAFLSAQAYNEVMTMHGTTMILQKCRRSATSSSPEKYRLRKVGG